MGREASGFLSNSHPSCSQTQISSVVVTIRALYVVKASVWSCGQDHPTSYRRSGGMSGALTKVALVPLNFTATYLFVQSPCPLSGVFLARCLAGCLRVHTDAVARSPLKEVATCSRPKVSTEIMK